MKEPQVAVNWAETGVIDILEWTCENRHKNGSAYLEANGCGKREREVIECSTCGVAYEGEWIGMKLKKVGEE